MRPCFVSMFAFLVNHHNNCIEARHKMFDLGYMIPITKNCTSCVFRNQHYYNNLGLKGYPNVCYQKEISEYIIKNTSIEDMKEIHTYLFERLL